MNILKLDIPEYNEDTDLTKLASTEIVEWTIKKKDVLVLEKLFKAKCKGVKKKKILIKTKRNSTESNGIENGNCKVIKLEVKQECDISEVK